MVYKIPKGDGTGNLCARIGWRSLKTFAADSMTVEPAAHAARRTLSGNCMPVTLSGRRRRAAGPPLSVVDMNWTDHQAFDPNRDNCHFKRGSICGLLGRLGVCRV